MRHRCLGPQRPCLCARADHIGSLLRPAKLRRAFRAFDEAAIGESEFRAIQDEAIRDVVRLQHEVGLDVVNDGEFRRGSYWSRFVQRTPGLAVGDAVFKFHDDQGHEADFTARGPGENWAPNRMTANRSWPIGAGCTG